MQIGIVGYGKLGKYLTNFILDQGDKHGLKLAFVWNRTKDKLIDVESSLVLNDLLDLNKKSVDLIVEVSHPNLVQEHGVLFLSVANLLIGSPTALANVECEAKLKEACETFKREVYIPSGAFWGAHDIQKMASLNTLLELRVTMKKHPSAFRLHGDIKSRNDELLNSSSTNSCVLYDGPVRELCSLAPNNVNTMAAAAIAAHNLGFDKVTGCLISDPGLLDWHIVEIEVRGKKTKKGMCFETITIRKNPADPGAVTGSATYDSFCNSLLQARFCRGTGFHMC